MKCFILIDTYWNLCKRNTMLFVLLLFDMTTRNRVILSKCSHVQSDMYICVTIQLLLPNDLSIYHYRSIDRSIYLSINLSIYRSIYRSSIIIVLSTKLSICLSIYRSITLSICDFIFLSYRIYQ
jgi:hypothetical protein